MPTSRTSPDRWSPPVVCIHWLTVITVVGVFGMAIGREFIEDTAARKEMLHWHRLAGMCAFVLALIRIPTRLRAAPPDHQLSRPLQVASSVGHGLLYLALLALPVLGYALSSARAGHVDVLGMSLPGLLPRDRDTAELIEGIHGTLGWAMLAFVGLHAAAALWHHGVRKDNVLRAMVPFAKNKNSAA